MDDLQIQVAVARLDLWVCDNTFWLELGAMTFALIVLTFIVLAIDR